MKEIVFKFYVWNGDWKHIEEYNRFEVDDSKVLTSDDMDKDAIQDYLGSEDYKNKSKGDLTNIYYETSLEDETGKTLQQIGMWASDYRKEKEIDMDNIPEAISRYIITEISYEFYQKNKYDRPEYHLHEGVVCEEGEWIDPHIKGIYKTEEEARKAFEKYETDIKTDISSIECGSGVRGLRVTEYYLHGVTFDLGEAIREVDDINSEEDFDKLFQTDYLRMSNYVVDDTDMNWRAVTRFSDNQRDELARKHLYSKMKDELRSYTEDLKRASAEDIIRRSYETVMKNELICLFYPDEERYNLAEITALKNCDNSLDTLYHRWMDVDLNLNELLEESVGEIVSDLAYSVERHSKLNAENNDNVKMKL